MVCKPTIVFEGALYHVNVRGNHRRAKHARVAYLDRIEDYQNRYRCIVYAYVLMSNHVHLLVETGAAANQSFSQSKSFRQALGSLSPSFLASQFRLGNTYGTVFAYQKHNLRSCFCVWD